nr:MAG TPA: hypothetical protein [Caudoviricetes sp.]
MRVSWEFSLFRWAAFSGSFDAESIFGTVKTNCLAN